LPATNLCVPDSSELMLVWLNVALCAHVNTREWAIPL
jgi:hypothetical protein